MLALIAVILIVSVVSAKPAAQSFSYTTSVQAHPLPTAPIIPAIPAHYNLGYTYYEPGPLVPAPLVYSYPSPIALGRSVLPATGDNSQSKIVIADLSPDSLLQERPLSETDQNVNIVPENLKALPPINDQIASGRNSIQEEVMETDPKTEKMDARKPILTQQPEDQQPEVQSDESKDEKPREKRHIAIYTAPVAAEANPTPARIVSQSLLAPAKIRSYPYTALNPLTYTYYSPYYAYLN